MTPSERRGALVLIGLCMLGAAWDLLHLRPRLTPEPPAEPALAAVAPAAPTAARPTEPAAPLDLNHASAAQLDGLPGIGPVLAGRIVEHRRAAGGFRSVDELLAVRGIGPHLFERLRPLVRVDRASRTASQDTMQNATRPKE